VSAVKATAAEPEPELVTVTAVHPYQIGYEGQVVGPGESLDVPVELADQWVVAGIATR